jgi:putative sterol carrier protein
MATPQELLADLAKRFRKDAAEGLDLVYQLHLTGDNGGVWHIAIADRECSLTPGAAARPDVTITMSAQDWEALMAGKLDAYTAFLQGRIEVAGDLSLAMKLQGLFGF